MAITGAAGLLGHGLVQWFRRAHEVIALTRTEMDVTSAASVQRAIAVAQSEVVIHCAAIPDLDLCEENPALTHSVNVEGTRHVAHAARDAGAAIAFISSDAVFDGEQAMPYTEGDMPAPRTVYGRTKVEGERIVAALPKHFIFRIPVLFGPGKPNFVSRGLDSLSSGQPCFGVTDQTGGALCTLDAGKTMEAVFAARAYGLYHLANAGFCSRFELLARAAALSGLDATRIIPRTRAEMRRPATRLRWMGMDMLSLDRARIPRPRPWQEALTEYVCALQQMK
jgi:dTDP-4-dehydrorhamnose reductase